MSATLFGANVSPFVRKVRAFLAEKGIDYTLDPVNPFAPPPGYRAISPLGKIPAWRDDDVTLADSSVICLYLERRHAGPALYPADDRAWAHALWIEEYIDSGFVPKAGGNVFFPLVLAPMFQDQPVTDEVRARVDACIAEELTPMWQYLENTLGEAEFFAGGALSVADLAVASIHVNLWHAGVDPDAARFPRLTAFLARQFARPALAALMAEEAPTWGRRSAA